jgi:hypothetical protein
VSTELDVLPQATDESQHTKRCSQLVITPVLSISRHSAAHSSTFRSHALLCAAGVFQHRQREDLPRLEVASAA